MRKLVVIAADHYLRQMVWTGAFDGIDGDDTYWVSSARSVSQTRGLTDREHYLGSVPEPEQRVAAYARLRQVTLASYRKRSRTLAVKVALLPWHQRWRYKLLALPGLRRLSTWWYLRSTGLHPELLAMVRDVRPDIVIAPSGGIDALVTDAIRVARACGVPSLVVAHNWDNLSSKGAFPVQPDHLGVWGEQSIEHAERIHHIPRSRVRALGAPSFEAYFDRDAAPTTPPFPFPYVLFAGCFQPFDELSALQRLEREIEQRGLDVKIVYRPHPHRRPRRRPDQFREEDFRHVVLDPQVREDYEASWSEYARGAARRKPMFPALDYYPALLEHARLVICPLSTMMVEAALFERRVLVVAYDDGIHPESPATAVTFDHFQGVDRIDGFEVCRRAEDLGQAMAAMLADERPPSQPLREQVRWWLHFDDRPYAERLAAFVREAAGDR